MPVTHSELSERLRFREATPDEFAEIVRPYVLQMARLAERLSGKTDRDDVVQDALIRAWEKRATFDPRRGSVAGWLMSITFDRARRLRRRRIPKYSQAEQPTVLLDDRIDIQSAVQELTDRQRLAVDCFYFADLSIAETATVMNCSIGTVKSTLSDARKQLSRILGDHRE